MLTMEQRMNGQRKRTEQLTPEVDQLRQRITALELSEKEHVRALQDVQDQHQQLLDAVDLYGRDRQLVDYH